LNFKILKTTMAPYQKNFFFHFNCYNLVIHVVTLIEIFLQTISIVRYKILWLEVENIISFWSLAHMSISTYFRPNIRQNSPEILGVNQLWHPLFYSMRLQIFTSYSTTIHPLFYSMRLQIFTSCSTTIHCRLWMVLGPCKCHLKM
jgi:hypothetical protein